MLDARHFAVTLGGSVSAATAGQPTTQAGHSVYGHHSEIQMTETW